MNNLDREVSDFILSRAGSWSDSTCTTAYHKLRVINKIGLNPQVLFETLQKEGYKKYTISTYFILARTFEEQTRKTTKIRKWMQDHRLQFKNAYKKKEKSMTSEQFNQILQKAEDTPRLYNFLILIGKAGLRKAEAFNVKWVDIKNDLLIVQNGKGGKYRTIPFKREWLKVTYSDYVAFRGNSYQIQLFFTTKCGDLTPHDFRSYYANVIVNQPGANLEDCRDLLGHANISSTAVYLRRDKDRQHKLVMEAFK